MFRALTDESGKPLRLVFRAFRFLFAWGYFGFVRQLRRLFAFQIFIEVTESGELDQAIQVVVAELLDQSTAEAPFLVLAAEHANHFGQEVPRDRAMKDLGQLFLADIHFDRDQRPRLKPAIESQFEALFGNVFDPAAPGLARLVPAYGLA